MTDSHCHLGSQRFADDEIADLVQRAADAGVHRLITLGTDPDDWARNLLIAKTYPAVSTCLGVHPCDVHEVTDDYRDDLAVLLENPEVAAVGETGLDYFHPAPEGWTEESYHQRQRDFLRQHFKLAKAAGLNVVIHTRDREGAQSFEDALAIYSDFASDVRAVFHCFIGSVANAQRVIDLGGCVSFTGIATFKKPGTVLEVAKSLQPSKFMVETDSPFLAPMPHRGKRNEPAYVAHTAAAIATARGESLKELVAHTETCVYSFFRLHRAAPF